MATQQQRPTDPWLERIGVLMALRGGGAESSIKESTQVSADTKVWMQAKQALMSAVAFFVLMFSCWGLVDGIVKTFQWDLKPGLYLLGLICFACLIYSSWAVVRFITRRSSRLFSMVMTGIAVFTLIAALITAGMSLDGDWETIRMIEVFGSIAFAYGSGLLLYNQTKYLIEPFWPRSPFETAVVDAVLNQPMPEPTPTQAATSRLIPFRHATGTSRILPVPEESAQALDPDPLDLEYLDWLEAAMNIGLSRNAWLDIRRHFPSTGRPVTRGKYDQMLQLAVDDGYVTPGGEGVAAHWTTGWTGEKAYRAAVTQFMKQWRHRLDLNSVSPKSTIAHPGPRPGTAEYQEQAAIEQEDENEFWS